MRFTSALLAVALVIKSTILQNATCPSNVILTTYGLTPTAATVVNNGTCSKYFATNGACASPGQIIAKMDERRMWLIEQAKMAVEMNYQYINATIYFQTLNGQINANTSVPENSGSFFDSIVKTFKDLVNRATKLFGQATKWVQSVFGNATNSVNPCFQAWANVTHGAHCILGSSHTVKMDLNALNVASPLSIEVDRRKTGMDLAKCSGLIDTYCSLAHGISISNSAMPFNTTLKWGDGGINEQGCIAFRDSFNNTNAQSVRDALYLGIFATNNVPFVFNRAAIDNLGAFLSALNPVAQPSTYTQVQKKDDGTGIRLHTGASGEGVDIMEVGKMSGQPKTHYTASIFAICSVFLTALSYVL